MPQPYDTVTMENYTVELLLLPLGSRDVTARTITLTSDVAYGQELIQITSSSANTVLKTGSSLSFITPGLPSRQHLLIMEDTVIDNINPIEVLVAPSKYEILSGATARRIEGLEPLFGVQDFALQESSTTVDTTNTRSGTGTETKPVRSSRTYQVSGVENRYTQALGGDKGLQIVKQVCRTEQLYGRELYMVSIYPDGETVEGAFVATDFNQPGNYNEVKKYSFTATLQGNSFQWTDPYATN